MNAKYAKRGDVLTYNDGRPGHTDARATVLDVGASGMSVQFADRMNPTYIMFHEREWMDHLSVVQWPADRRDHAGSVDISRRDEPHADANACGFDGGDGIG